MITIEPRTGTGFRLRKGEKLRVVDLEGQQVSDFFAVMEANPKEVFSAGRTMDYLSRIYLREGDTLYSSESRPMARLIADEVGKHDILLTPCSKDTFRIIYGDQDPHHGCEGNLRKAFAGFGIHLQGFPATFNIFMNVQLDSSGEMKVLPPISKAGQAVVIEALEDLIVGLTACSALQSNNYSFKPIGYEVISS